ncbi:MAG: carboxypeptidase M32 [Acidobacteriota bacterium]
MRNSEEQLRALWGEIHDLQSIQQLLDWDQETKMPEAAHGARASMCGTLAALKHRLLTDDRLWESILACAEDAESGGDLEAQARVARRAVARARRVPESLTRALAEARSRGTAAWQEARKQSEWRLFEPALEELVSLTREEAAAAQPDLDLYDALLEKWEPGAREADLVPIFDDLLAELVPLVGAIADSGRTIDESPVAGVFPEAGQRALATHAAAGLGFDFKAGRLDLAAHPFCVGLAPSDVRLTWRFDTEDPRPGLFGVLHEAGHGLYEQGLPSAWMGTPLGAAVSLGIHESQSRFVENQIGRSLGFWRWLLPTFHAHFPHTAGHDAEALWPTLHVVKPSLIRVDADETTYNLHVAIRFELERELFGGGLTVADLPSAWDERYASSLGVRAPSASDGVLQDIHWSQAIFGYFPTYTLGSLNASQLTAALRRDLGLEEDGAWNGALAAGEFGPILGWLREKVHGHGSRFDAPELIERATGRAPSADDLVADLKRNAEVFYGVGA